MTPQKGGSALEGKNLVLLHNTEEKEYDKILTLPCGILMREVEFLELFWIEGIYCHSDGSS